MSSTNTETPIAPSVNINDKKYFISELDDKSKSLLNDLTRTVMDLEVITKVSLLLIRMHLDLKLK